MNPRLTRQELLRRGAAGGALMAFPSLLAACGGGGGGGGEASGELKDVLNFENWPYYMDTKQLLTAQGITAPTTLEQFTEKTGIKVNYYEGIDSNDGYFAKVQGRSHRATGSAATSSSLLTTRSFQASMSRRGMSRSSTRTASPTSTTSSTPRRARASTRAASTRFRGSPASTGSAGTKTSRVAR